MTGELKQGQTDDALHGVRPLEIGDLVVYHAGDQSEVGEVVGIVARGVLGIMVHLRFSQYVNEKHVYNVDVAALKRVGG